MRYEGSQSPNNRNQDPEYKKKKICILKAQSPDRTQTTTQKPMFSRENFGLHSSMNFLNRMDLNLQMHSPVKKKPQATHRRVVSMSQKIV